MNARLLFAYVIHSWLQRPVACKLGRHRWNSYAADNGHRMCNRCRRWVDDANVTQQF